MIPPILTIQNLSEAYRTGKMNLLSLVDAVRQRIAQAHLPEIWISLVDEEKLSQRITALQTHFDQNPTETFSTMPLFGIPFAVKDNIDVEGLVTTVGCPAFAYTPTCSAEVVRRLEQAGAILIGKTNLDQFATGLVGTRSPYGAVKNPFNPDYIAGGSSSGSAAAVAHGMVAFALGTDTAGSGRVPAGFNNLVGIKPTPGLVSTRGVFPACRSLDCVSIFSHHVDDGWQIMSSIAGFDSADPYSRNMTLSGPLTRRVRIGIPDVLTFFGDNKAEAAFALTLDSLRQDTRISIHTIPFTPFQEVATMLYDGPWLSERYTALGTFMETHGDDMNTIVRQIISRAQNQKTSDAFRAFYRLETLKQEIQAIFADIDILLVPTTPHHPTLRQAAEHPIEINTQLGTYTNFVNLLGMSALALPGHFRTDGLPAGITLIGPGGADYRLAEFARGQESVLHKESRHPIRDGSLPPLPDMEPVVTVAVVGAHLSGQPLNWQLLERGGRIIRSTRTSPNYRLYLLPDTVPAKPGLLRVSDAGVPIELELWALPIRNYGSFIADIPAPLGIGMLELEDGSQAQGFLCEAYAVKTAQDISAFGGWRSYCAQANHS